jgi:hypothetical protein
MPERIEQLRATLAELESELSELPEMSAEQRGAIEAAIAEIHAVLLRAEASIDASPKIPHEENRWREAVAGFEVSHPQLAGLLSRVIDSLSQVGI